MLMPCRIPKHACNCWHLPLLFTGAPSTVSSSSTRSTWCLVLMMGEHGARMVPGVGRMPPQPPHPSHPCRSLALWGLTKKKPLALARQAHGEQDGQGLQQPYWISAVAALRNSDLLATGVWQLPLAAGGGNTSCSHPWAGVCDRLLSVPQDPTAAV